jgi:hypothetical protein
MPEYPARAVPNFICLRRYGRSWAVVLFENIVQNAIVYVCFAVFFAGVACAASSTQIAIQRYPTLSDLQTREQGPTIGRLLLLLLIDRKSGFLGYFFV